MLKKTMHLFLLGILTLNLCGCFALFAGVAGGAGTAIWLSGKLTQEFHASYPATRDATHLALEELNLKVVEETQNENATQVKGAFSDGREMWIDIQRINDYSTRVEVRVGGVNSDKEAAGIVLRKIQSLL